MPSFPRWVGYSVAALATVAVTAGRYAFDRQFGAAPHFLLPFVVPILVAAWFGGGPGLFATALNAAVIASLLEGHGRDPDTFEAADRVRVGVFLGIGLFVSAFCDSFHRYRRRLEVMAAQDVRRYQELLSEVTERREAERRLTASQALLRLVTDHVPVLLVHCDRDMRYTFVNRTYADRFGLEPQDVLGRTVPEVLGPVGYGRIKDHLAAALAGETAEFEADIPYPSTGFRRVHCTCRPEVGAGGRVNGFVATILDITERVRADDALRRSERRYRALVQATPQVVWTSGAAENGGAGWWSDLTGQPESEAAGWGWLNAVHPDDRDRVRAAWTAAYTNHTLYDTEFRAFTRSGACRHFAVRGVALTDAGGNLEEWVGTLTDVHDRTLTQERLREVNATLERRVDERTAELREHAAFSRGVLDALPAHIAVVDRAGTITAVNRAWEQFAENNPGATGATSGTGVGVSYLAVCGDSSALGCADARKASGAVRRVLAGSGAWTGLEYDCHGPAERRWFSLTVTPLPAGNGAVVSHTDITSRKLAEEALREEEQRFRNAFEHAPIGMALVSPGGRWLRVNRSLCELFGYTTDELLATDFQTLTHPDDLAVDLALAGQVVAGAVPSYQLEKRYFHKDGHVVHTLLSVSLVRGGTGRPVYYISQIKDISQRKEVERSLAAHDALLRQFIKHSPAAIAMFDRDLRYVQASDRWLADYNLTGRDIIGGRHYDVFPDISDAWKAIHARVLAGATERRDEDPFHGADGSTEWLQWECRPWHDASGEVAGLIMFTQVITGRKRAEADLRASEGRFRVLFEQSSDAHLIFSEADGILDCNPAAVAMLRCPDKRALLRLHPAELSPDLQPDGRRSMEKCVEMDAVARRDGYHRFDWDHRRMDGGVFPCEVTLTPVTLDGRAVLLVVWHELTERKRAEQALRNSEERFRAAMEGSLDSVFFLAADRGPDGTVEDFRFTELNQRGSKLLSRCREQVLGLRLCELLPLNRTDGFFDKYVRVVETGEPLEEEFTVAPSGGLNASWLHHQVVRVGDGVAITTQDITARKRVEAALRMSEERFRRLVDGVADHAIFMLDVGGHVVSWNPGAEQIKGYIAEEILGRHFSVFYTPEAVAAGHPQRELAVAVAEGRYHEEGERVRNNGSRFWAAVTISALRDDTGRHVGFVKFTHDVSQRKHSEEQLQASLREKDVMLKEIHHRVKNNLQIVSALLELQSEHTADASALTMFQESRGRVKSMAMIHERLYLSHDMARVDFGEYIRQLASDLYSTYKVSDDIRLELDVDIPPLPIDIAIPCGLLLNELMSNCFKHAFKDAAAGCIRVSLHHAEGDTNVLVVSDDGAGFPAGTDFRNTTSFGLQLVKTLVDQLDGEAELTADGGTTFVIRFPNIKQ